MFYTRVTDKEIESFFLLHLERKRYWRYPRWIPARTSIPIARDAASRSRSPSRGARGGLHPSWSVYLCGALPPAAGDRFRELAHTHMQMSGQREHTVGEKVTSLACSVYIVVVHDVHRVSSTLSLECIWMCGAMPGNVQQPCARAFALYKHMGSKSWRYIRAPGRKRCDSRECKAHLEVGCIR